MQKTNFTSLIQESWPIPDPALIFIRSISTMINIDMVLYECHGVKEYWIMHPETKIIEHFLNENDRFTLTSEITSGEKLASHILPGLHLSVEVKSYGRDPDNAG